MIDLAVDRVVHDEVVFRREAEHELGHVAGALWREANRDDPDRGRVLGGEPDRDAGRAGQYVRLDVEIGLVGVQLAQEPAEIEARLERNLVWRCRRLAGRDEAGRPGLVEVARRSRRTGRMSSARATLVTLRKPQRYGSRGPDSLRARGVAMTS